MKKNVLVAQSGGPSPVINASLQGIIDSCLHYNGFGEIYGSYRGIEGVLCEELIDLRAQSSEEIALLKHTPASGFIGTCRYKLNSENTAEFQRIIDVIKAHDIGYFFYIGGNDSMDTADKVSKLAQLEGLELVVVGIPKTIDNDIGDSEFKIIDHTPGYGSCARYWAYLMQNANEENKAISTSECVSVYQSMGRKTGFITAAARLGDPNREMPLQLYMSETGQTLESLGENVNNQLKQSGRCIVVVNEGFDIGGFGAKHDGFGHVEYGASETTAAQAVVNYLNRVGLKARGQATGQVPGVIQRSVSTLASTVDIEEAYQVAVKAVEISQKDGTGYMSTILRKDTADYQVYYDKVPLETVANSVRYMPDSWISPSKLDVTDDFIKYAAPLIGTSNPEIKLENGLQRFARLNPVFIDKSLPAFEIF